MEKNSTMIYRKATKADDCWEIARILYGTDPYIYPSWYDTAEQFSDAISSRMRTSGFIFHYSHLYIAKQEYPRHATSPVAVLAILNCRSNLNYDYKKLRQQSPRVITEYILPTIATVQKLPNPVAYGLAFCVSPSVRRQGIGEQLFRFAIQDLKSQNIDTLCFDCLRDNPAARNLYEKIGFSVVSEGIGFKKTGTTAEVPIVTFAGTF